MLRLSKPIIYVIIATILISIIFLFVYLTLSQQDKNEEKFMMNDAIDMNGDIVQIELSLGELKSSIVDKLNRNKVEYGLMSKEMSYSGKYNIGQVFTVKGKDTGYFIGFSNDKKYL